jgi:glyoxylase-like metal-dependent hydrolase (beta-lactamase superfamily II)
MPVSRRFGPATVYALTDGEGPFFQPRAAAFPAATAALWAQADRLDPAAERGGGWWLRFRCFLVRLDSGHNVLVDTGIGGADAPARSWAPVPGTLPAELAAVGVTPAEVDTVIVTHLHSDHVGWAVDGGAPFFGNARYLLPRADINAVDRLNPSLDAALLEPLRSTGQLTPVDHDADGGLDVAEGLRLVATPGHTPGHQSVLLDGRVLFTGDLLVHAAQLIDPALPYAHDDDPGRAARSRATWLRVLHGVLATSHLGEPFVEWPAAAGQAPRSP